MKMSLARLIMILIATIALIFTFAAGILSNIPWINILQRTIIAFIFFSFAGYFFGNWCEQYLGSLYPETPEDSEAPEETLGQNFDTVSQEPEKAPGTFDPFTVNSFEHIETK